VMSVAIAIKSVFGSGTDLDMIAAIGASSILLQSKCYPNSPLERLLADLSHSQRQRRSQ